MKKVLLPVLAVVSLLVAATSAAAQRPSAAGTERVLVGFSSTPGAAHRAAVERAGGTVLKTITGADALAVQISGPGRSGLARLGGVQYVEDDELRYPLGLADAQLTPSLQNGLYGLITTKSTTVHSRGVTGAGVKACVADTGLDYTHPDIKDNYISGIDEVSNDMDPWWNNDPNEVHGTHVAGTVLGVNNTVGVFGVAYGSKMHYARVLGPNGGFSSDIMNGVEWLVNQGCKVVNLSLGGGRFSKTEERFYNRMKNAGALIVAAAGNDSATKLSYPAGYTSVLSVGAVDVNNVHASFSNTGNGLDISAPGVLVLSSVPAGQGSEASVSAGATYRAFGLEYAGRTAGLTGTLVNCGLGTAGSCPVAVAGNIALIQRGSISFADKVTNAMNQGAAAAIIYNNAAGDFVGTLGSAGNWIPAVSVSDATGAALLQQTSATVVNQASSWDHFDGTSMATPHVTGVAALVWSANSSFSNTSVENTLKSTATDLGAAGYDTTYGYGLVNADKAVASAGK